MPARTEKGALECAAVNHCHSAPTAHLQRSSPVSSPISSPCPLSLRAATPRI
jgi:hypothetical protein